jgi:hypothetical protein
VTATLQGKEPAPVRRRRADAGGGSHRRDWARVATTREFATVDLDGDLRTFFRRQEAGDARAG